MIVEQVICIDIIFDTTNNICRADDLWYLHAVKALFIGIDVLLVSSEELIWCKIYVQNRERFDVFHGHAHKGIHKVKQVMA